MTTVSGCRIGSGMTEKGRDDGIAIVILNLIQDPENGNRKWMPDPFNSSGQASPAWQDKIKKFQMLSYLKKFNELPPEVKNAVSSPEAMAEIERLEKEYDVSLAALLMRSAVKEISVAGLPALISEELKLDGVKATELFLEIKDRIFSRAAGYFGVKKELSGAAEESKMAAKEETPALAKTAFPKINKPVPPAKPIGVFGVRPVAKISASPLIFSPEDEEEIKQLAAQVKSFAKFSSFDSEESALDGLLAEIGKDFGSETARGRLRQILKTYLTGVRDRLETRIALGKNFSSGGLGLDERMAERIISAADRKIKEKSGKKSPAAKNIAPANPLDKIAAREIEEALGRQAIGRRKEFGKPEQGTAKKTLPSGPEEKMLPAPGRIAGSGPANAPARIKKTIRFPFGQNERAPVVSAPAERAKAVPLNKILPEKVQVPKKMIEREAPKEIKTEEKKPKTNWDYRGGKKIVRDVKFVPAAMNPIDEMSSLNLKNFRRLSSKPDEAAEKIISKIELLGEENYVLKLEAVRAWRKSPLHMLYLKTGEESFVTGKPVEALATGGESLTKEEFGAIAEMNRKLRF